MTAPIEDTRLPQWLAPIAQPPAEPRFHPAFETVRSETAKLDSPAAGIPDWAAVLASGDLFLREVGKDLVVATSMTLALGHREGARGLATGLALVSTLLRAADTAPLRGRARANALGFLATRAESLWDGRPSERDRATLQATSSALAALVAASSEVLAGEAPSFRGLADRIQRATESLPAEAPPTPPPPPAPVTVFVPPPPPPALPVSAPEAPRTESLPTQLRQHAASIVETSAGMRAATTTLDAEPLRVWLVGLYLPLGATPPVSKGTRTALPPPTKLVLESIARASVDTTPDLAMRDVMGAIERSRLALDLHFHLARVLARADAADALRVHRHEMAGLHARLPALVTLEFSDGTPLATPDTRAWLDGLVRGPETSAPNNAERSPLEGARELARDGRISEALVLASRARNEAPSARARFEATLGLAALAEEARAIPLAEELHAALLREIDERRLDVWDPLLTATALAAHLRLARATPGKDVLSKSLFGRLAVVDPTAALTFATSSHATLPKTIR